MNLCQLDLWFPPTASSKNEALRPRVRKGSIAALCEWLL